MFSRRHALLMLDRGAEESVHEVEARDIIRDRLKCSRLHRSKTAQSQAR